MKSKKATTKSPAKKTVKKAIKKVPVKKSKDNREGKIYINSKENDSGTLDIELSMEGSFFILAETIAELIMKEIRFKNLYLAAVQIISKKLGKK